MSNLQLTVARRRRLEQQLRDAADAGLFRRTLAILEAAGGRPIAEIARLLRTSRVSVYHWIDCYERAHDPRALADQRGGNHPSLQQAPEYFGYQAVAWSVPLLREHLERWCGACLSEMSIRRQMHDLGYVWKPQLPALPPAIWNDPSSP